jgi:hypothetical protein
MKPLIALLTLLLLAACTTTPTAKEETIGSVAASANTQSKTGIKFWNLSIVGNSSTTVKGTDASGKVFHSIDAIRNSNGTARVVKCYFDGSGTKVRTDTFEINAAKQLTLKPTTPTDASLCPECMANDLEALATTGAFSIGTVQPQANLPCIRAQNRLARFAAQLSQLCVVGGDPIACGNAAVGYFDAFNDVISNCI